MTTAVYDANADSQAFTELQMRYRAFEATNSLGELSSEEDDDEILGLRQQEKDFEDFDGCPVKPTSVVGSSNVIIMTSRKNLPQVGITVCKKSDDEWIHGRDKFLRLQETKLWDMHQDIRDLIVEVEKKLDAVQDVSGDSLLSALYSPSKTVECLVRLEDYLRNAYQSLNLAVMAINPRRLPAPYLPRAEFPPEDCNHAIFLTFFEDVKARVQSISEMFRCRSSLFLQLLEEIEKGRDTPGFAKRYRGKITAESSAENVISLHLAQASTFFVRNTSPEVTARCLSSLEKLDTQLTFLLQCHAGGDSVGDIATRVVSPRHRPLMPAVMQQVSKSSLFNPFQDNLDFLAAVEEHMQPIFVPAGNTLMVRGTIGQEMFFVQSGCCQVTVDGVVRGDRRSGEFFGEIALLNATKRCADVQVTEDAELLLLPKASFDHVVKKYPHMMQRIQTIGNVRKKKLDEEFPRLISDDTAEDEGGVRVGAGLDWSSIVEEPQRVRHSNVTLMEMVQELEDQFKWRAVAANEVVLAAGQSKVGIQFLWKGSCCVHDSKRLHACEEGAVFGLGALFYSGKIGCDVMAGPAGAEMLHLEERQLFEYFHEEPSAVQLLKAVLEAQVDDGAADFWQCV